MKTLKNKHLCKINVIIGILIGILFASIVVKNNAGKNKEIKKDTTIHVKPIK